MARNHQHRLLRGAPFVCLLAALICLPAPFSHAGTGAAGGTPPNLASLQKDITSVARRTRPSVAGVRATLGPPPLERIGSGFVVDSRGYVLTNAHVVRNAVLLHLTFPGQGGREVPAVLKGMDTALDLAVLKAGGNGFYTPAVYGPGNIPEVGDYLLCSGSPFDFDQSLSLGIVSALHREMRINGTAYPNMIQTDALLNEGNSGGPVMDMNGRVVGISTAVYAPGGTSMGLGFAIPMDRAVPFIQGVLKAAGVPPGNTGGKAAPPLPTTGAGGASPLAPNLPLLKPPVDNQLLFFKLVPLVLIATVVLSMTGIGGGFVYVPLLLSCGIDFKTAATTSLLMLTFGQLAAVYTFFKSGLVDLKTAILLEFPTMAGAFFGGMHSKHFNDHVMSLTFSGLLLVTSWAMMQGGARQAGADTGKGLFSFTWFQWHRKFRGAAFSIDLCSAMPLLFFVGYIGGMLGFGGGWLTVPIMVIGYALPMKIAVATSSLMVPFTGAAGFAGHSVAGHLDPMLAVVLSVAAAVGGYAGSKLSVGTDSNRLKFYFSFILCMVGVWMAARLL